jgi:hypothetical protein
MGQHGTQTIKISKPFPNKKRNYERVARTCRPADAIVGTVVAASPTVKSSKRELGCCTKPGGSKSSETETNKGKCGCSPHSTHMEYGKNKIYLAFASLPSGCSSCWCWGFQTWGRMTKRRRLWREREKIVLHMLVD